MEVLGIEASDCNLVGNSVDVEIDNFDDFYELRCVVLDNYSCQHRKDPETNKLYLHIHEVL